MSTDLEEDTGEPSLPRENRTTDTACSLSALLRALWARRIPAAALARLLE